MLSVEASDYYVIFNLDTGKLPILIDELTLDEARIAYDHLSRKSNQNVYPDIDDDPKPETEDKNKGFLDAMFYMPPAWVMEYRAYLAIGVMLVTFTIVGSVLVINYLNDMPINNDKNEAVSIAMNGTSLQQFIVNKDVSLETTEYYYDPAAKNYVTTRGKYMDAEIQAWVFHNATFPDPSYNFTYREMTNVEGFSVIVDLEHKSIIGSSERSIFS